MALYKRGPLYWASFTAPDGTRVRCSTGTSDRQKAQEFFDKLKHESWRVSRMGEKPRHTWDEAALLWLEEKADKKSIESDKVILRFLTPILRGKYLNEITRADIVQIGEERKRATSPSRANRYLALLRAILNRAVKIWEWLDKAPTVTLYKEPKRRIRYLTPDQIQRLMQELPAHQKPVVAFALLTGLRKSNILNLRWSQIDLAGKMIHIAGKEMKNGNDHTVPLSDAALQIVITQIGKNPEYVFTLNGQKLKEVNTQAFRNALKRAGITDYRFHDNRHTWASTLVQNGVSLYELQEMGAWQSAEMVKRYAHLAPRKLQENAEIVADVLEPSVTILSQSKKRG